jgi:hypothetical protein
MMIGRHAQGNKPAQGSHMISDPSRISILDICRRNIGPAPRRFSPWTYWTYLRTATPPWATGDRLGEFFHNQSRVLKDGGIVLGHIVQANSQLYRAGKFYCPGEVVYCVDPSVVVAPSHLAAVATHLFALKGQPAETKEEQYISYYLAHERTRVFGLPVPSTVSANIPCAISTVYFNRKHLAGGKLSSTLMPLLITRDVPRYAMVLPAKYWPTELT